ncbi:MAG: hypothetical protein IJM64_00835 [Ottowia sp.]|nr:hypothetical protein [Ottowia sp.]
MTATATAPRARSAHTTRRKEAPAAPAPAPAPLRDNIADSRKLIAELDARPPDAPISEIGRILHELRRKHKEEGGTFITSDEEFEREVRRYRYGIED